MLTKQEFISLKKDVKEALKSVEKKYNISFSPTDIKYSINEFSLKLDAVVINEDNLGKTPEQIHFENNCYRFGFTPSDYNKKIIIDGADYFFIGFNKKAKKNVCIIKSCENNKTYVTPSTIVRTSLAAIA